MSSSRAESQAPQYGRRRSNTAQSLYRPPPQASAIPLRFGDTKTLTIWVHDPNQPPGSNVILNHAHWPGVAEGDMLADESSGFLFSVQKDEASARQQLSIPRPVAEKFGLRNHGEVTLTKIDKSKYCANYVELTFQDQYLGRNEMWRLGSHLVGQCIYVHQEISFIGVIGAKVQAIYIDGRKVPAAYVTPATKTVYRSLSAKVTIFIQVCRELWQFAGDGERYNEKIVHSFLPELFSQWNEAKTNHIVTIVLISRVFYDSSEIHIAAGPLRQDDSERWYKDFFKVITDLEVLYDWKPTLVDLKTSFWDFQRDILLAHHFHHASRSSETQPGEEQVRLVGQLSYARDGPLLEALNLGLNPTETHYIDRSLSLTGSSTIIITPGTGYFHVGKELLRLTTTRLLDQGFAVELVSLAKPPLHQSPIFSFQAVDPELTATTGKGGPRALDPLWADDDASHEWDAEKSTFWWEPFWMMASFWDKQMDQPIRPDRFVARAKMHEIEMLGLLDHDVLSNIEIPFLTNLVPNENAAPVTAEDADQFDSDIFSYGQEPQVGTHMRRSLTLTSSGSGTLSRASTVRLSGSFRVNAVNRASTTSAFPSIEESPRNPLMDLPLERSLDAESRLLSAPSGGLSTSPSQSSMRSVRSSYSHKSTASAMSSTSHRSRTSKAPLSRGSTSMKSRLTPSWLFNPFRSGISQPQTSPVSVSTSRGANSETQDTTQSTSSDNSSNTSTAVPTPEQNSPEKKAVQIPRSNSVRKRPTDEETLVSRQASPRHLSPLNASPRDSFLAGRRRTISKTSTQLSLVPSAPPLRTDPSKPTSAVLYPLSSLARRWQHLFPQPLSKHDIKWKAMIIPGCLPLTTEFFPFMSELETTYDMHPYDFVVDPADMQSFLVRPPSAAGNADDVRRAWALIVMRGMVAVRLAQGFQFVIRPPKSIQQPEDAHNALRRARSYLAEDDTSSKPVGIADVLKSADDPVYLSMSNEIHRIAYIGDSIQVRRWVRTMPRTRPLSYQCLIWPKLGVGYTELVTSFVSHGLENYGWNRLDMLVAGYESQFNESIRYWRTRFVVIPTDESPSIHNGPNGEELNEEEVRLLGIDKLAELFSRARWIPPEDRGKPVPPIRFLTTDLDPAASVLDESLTAQLEDIHASGPLRKKPKSARDIGDTSLLAIAKAMREEDGVPIKEHRWHGKKYANSFTGSDFVSWLVREFRDVSTREQGTEWGGKLQEQGLFEHCRGAHGFLDGHYFYTLRGEYLIPMTPRGGGWFRASRHVSGEEPSMRPVHYPGNVEKGSPASRKAKKRLIFSQSMVIDTDPNKRSDQAEAVILHHDIIHNPATCFHFELQWIGTTARCIDDLLRQWSRTIERYGLKLVEGYVTQICDIQERNPFQSCFPVPLAEPPPIVPDFENRVVEGVQTRHYFEYAILRKFGFVVDIEAASLYPDSVDVVYSYRRSPFKYSQWVHRSGVAFVQVLGGREGFLFLTNRLMAPGRIGTALNYQRPAAAAEQIRMKLQRLCSDREALRRFYEDEIAQLPPTLDEPPPLRI